MIGQFIPQVVYDIIGRLVPGSTILGTAWLIWGIHIASPLPASDLPFTTPAAFVLAAYVLALLLEGLWEATLGNLTRDLGKDEARKKVVAGFLEIAPGATTVAFPGIPIIYDIIRLKSPALSANIVKLRAEAQLCRTLLLGSFILFVALFIDVGCHGATRQAVAILLFLAAVLVASGAQLKFRQLRTFWSMYNHWLLLVQPGVEILERGDEVADPPD